MEVGDFASICPWKLPAPSSSTKPGCWHIPHLFHYFWCLNHPYTTNKVVPQVVRQVGEHNSNVTTWFMVDISNQQNQLWYIYHIVVIATHHPVYSSNVTMVGAINQLVTGGEDHLEEQWISQRIPFPIGSMYGIYMPTLGVYWWKMANHIWHTDPMGSETKARPPESRSKNPSRAIVDSKSS